MSSTQRNIIAQMHGKEKYVKRRICKAERFFCKVTQPSKALLSSVQNQLNRKHEY